MMMMQKMRIKKKKKNLTNVKKTLKKLLSGVKLQLMINVNELRRPMYLKIVEGYGMLC